MAGTTMRTTAAALATGAALVLVPAAGAAESPTAAKLTLRDSLYRLPLSQPAASPQCALVLCPIVQATPSVGSGPDSGVSGLRVMGFPLAPSGVTAEARSEPQPFEGAGDDGTASVLFSAARSAEGAGGTVTTDVRLDEVGGGTVITLPSTTVPLDGARHVVGPVPLDPKRLVVGRSYVAVARFTFSVPAGGDITARIFAPELLALGPEKKTSKPKPLKPRKPKAALTGRSLRVTVACPAGPARCDVQTRSSLEGRTIGKGSADLQAGAEHTFTYRLSAAELRRARRVGLITTNLRIVDEKKRSGSSRSSLVVKR
jgi:hypothetical protein